MNNLLKLKGQSVVVAIKSSQDTSLFIDSKVNVCFLLGGEILKLRPIIKLMKEQGKQVFVHMDLIDGVSKDSKGVRLIADILAPNGIITTKGTLIKNIKEHGLIAGQRCFMLDSQSYSASLNAVLQNKPDFLEVLPGLMPSIIRRFTKDTKLPLVASGLIETKEDAMLAIKNGAVAISTSNIELWQYLGEL